MRLLDTRTYEIHEFQNEVESLRYAILSHTWGKDECTLQHMSMPSRSKREGYKKIKYCCEQAVRDGLDWAWVDTCCIDKTSTAELSEAINSMFRWYRNAAICYTYLVDVTNVDEFGMSVWFTRGWTLQELLASRVMRFYSTNWSDLGSQLDLQDEIEKTTGIEKSVLSTGHFEQVTIAKRMSWAANRGTTRIEDVAYSLLGIFGVNMPLLYGEGTRSFIRLQEEIMKVSDDHTLFAWGLPWEFNHVDRSGMQHWFNDLPVFNSPAYSQLRGLLARSPSEFVTDHDVRSSQKLQPDMPPIMSSNGVRIELPVWAKPKLPYQFAAISCCAHGRYLGIPLRRWDERFIARSGPLVLLSEDDWSSREKEILLIKQPPTSLPPLRNFNIVRTSKQERDCFTIDEIYCPNFLSYSHDTQYISFSIKQKGPHAVLFFSPSVDFNKLLLDKYHPQLIQQRVENDEYGLEGSSGYSFVSSFAIVLGSDTKPWAAFVPILNEDSAEEDFHKLLRGRQQWAEYCTTKEKLKVSLNDDKELLLDKQDHFDKSLHRTKSAWYQQFGLLQFRANKRKGAKIYGFGSWDVELCLKLHVRESTVAQTAVFVCIDISIIGGIGSSRTKMDESHQAQFDNSWWEAPGFSGIPRVNLVVE